DEKAAGRREQLGEERGPQAEAEDTKPGQQEAERAEAQPRDAVAPGISGEETGHIEREADGRHQEPQDQAALPEARQAVQHQAESHREEQPERGPARRRRRLALQLGMAGQALFQSLPDLARRIEAGALVVLADLVRVDLGPAAE